MTARETRNRRRAEERKAYKLARKAEKSGNRPPLAEPSAGRFNPELEDEFPRELQIQANLVRDRVHQNIALDKRGFVSQSGAELIKRAEINRQNALHSTGPRTPEGKVASSGNSLKHGLASGQVIIPGEDPAPFEALLHDLLEEHQPASPTEALLVNEMAQSYWLSQRALRLQNECFTENGVDEKRLSLFLRYQTTHERAFHKALNTLLKLKKVNGRGFVSQAQHQTRGQSGFVSQNDPKNPPTHAPADEAAVFSEPKTQATVFVWQNDPKPLAEAA